MSHLLRTRGVPNLAEKVHRNGKNRHANNSKHQTSAPSLNENILIRQKLRLLAEKMRNDAYAQKKPSEVLIREFIAGVQLLRGWLWL